MNLHGRINHEARNKLGSPFANGLADRGGAQERGGGECHGVIMAFPIPASKSRKRQHRPLEKGAFPGIKVRLESSFVESLRAAAQCVGLDFYHFVYWGLRRTLRDAERSVGIPHLQMVAISKRARAELGKKVRALRTVGLSLKSGSELS